MNRTVSPAATPAVSRDTGKKRRFHRLEQHRQLQLIAEKAGIQHPRHSALLAVAQRQKTLRPDHDHGIAALGDALRKAADRTALARARLTTGVSISLKWLKNRAASASIGQW